ncbi:hypothetical protein N9060_02600, partial [Arenicella sp.]|nr:hypothetical protein [Arenicella sp.]
TGWRGSLSGREVQANFRPALGFVSRDNVRQYAGQAGYTLRFNNPVLRSVFSGIDAQRVNVLGGGLQSKNIVFRVAELENNTGDELTFRVESVEENLTEDFEISAGILIAEDDYSFTQAEVSIETAAQRRADISASYRFGDFYDGDITSTSVAVNWRPSKNYSLGVSYSQDEVDLVNGSFTTKLASGQVDIVLSNAISWVNLIQYDNVSESIGFNSRLQWTPRAGQNFFFVVNQNYVEELDNPLSANSSSTSFRSDASDITVKFDYTYRF